MSDSNGASFGGALHTRHSDALDLSRSRLMARGPPADNLNRPPGFLVWKRSEEHIADDTVYGIADAKSRSQHQDYGCGERRCLKYLATSHTQITSKHIHSDQT